MDEVQKPMVDIPSNSLIISPLRCPNETAIHEFSIIQVILCKGTEEGAIGVDVDVSFAKVIFDSSTDQTFGLNTSSPNAEW